MKKIKLKIQLWIIRRQFTIKSFFLGSSLDWIVEFNRHIKKVNKIQKEIKTL